MKLQCAILPFLIGVCHASGRTAAPIDAVIKLLSDLKGSIEKESKEQQKVFDKYACWCEDMLAKTANDISKTAKVIESSKLQLLENKANDGTLQGQIKGLKKQVKQNGAERKEAAAIRKKEHTTYANEKLEYESTIGALQSAIKVFGGKKKKKGFLDTSSHQAELLSVAGQIRTALTQQQSAWNSMEDPDSLQVLRSFVSDPEAFLSDRNDGVSALQESRNPFGDFAPPSTQIQGILKGMYDSFTAELKKINAEEAESKKSFEELAATKEAEKKTLTASLLKQETADAGVVKKITELAMKEDLAEEMKSQSEEFFADTKDSCKKRAREWALRTRLRTEELAGIENALEILSSEGAKATFKSSQLTFLQLSTVENHQTRGRVSVGSHLRLSKIAARTNSVKLARIASSLKAGGHFDEIMTSIDNMLGELRKEGQDDIQQRDTCENKQNANTNELADLDAALEKTDTSLKQLGNTKTELLEDIAELKKDIKSSKADIQKLTEFREKAVAAFVKSQNDDANAKQLILQARDSLLKFYQNNKLEFTFVQQLKHAVSDKEGPEILDEKYGGRKTESTNILALLELLADDVTKEMAEAKADDAEAEEEYNKQMAALEKTLSDQEATKAFTEKELADLEEKMDQYQQYKKGKTDDKKAGSDVKKALDAACKWIKSHFETRKKKRKDEIEGLVDAKNFLAGVEAGQDPLPVD